jgi:hypothetical protein
MTFLLTGITSLIGINAKNEDETPRFVIKGDSTTHLNVIIVPEVKIEEVMEKVKILENIAIRRARILARLNFLFIAAIICMSIYAGIQDVPVLSITSGIILVVLSFLQWGPLSESYAKVAVGLQGIHRQLTSNPYLYDNYYKNKIEDYEIELRTIHIISYLWL